MKWIMGGKLFDCAELKGHIGFVYLITHKISGKRYFGRKLFWFAETKPPLKGKKNKRHSRRESDWLDYLTSSKEVQGVCAKEGTEAFTWEIIHLCRSKSHLAYMEAKEQFANDVLLRPDEFYNGIIRVTVGRIKLT